MVPSSSVGGSTIRVCYLRSTCPQKGRMALQGNWIALLLLA